ncbi:ATP-dependent RNA helicase dbp6 [Conoideocrella luteorostrata]|uniref:ATP-dependent RNA helicase n=1 Tax=Conoideocrella luteorostrata TaxID=1105319 RepID=A0AAJ0FW32_9HYPO|nr:ATP-dependent RNA helicase dbp6 [Conoideocrella luteorostrata]
MYARYIPPSKGSDSPAPTQSPAVAIPDPKSSLVAKSDTTQPKLVEQFSYTRYVPAPKKPKPISAVAAATPEPKPIQYFDDEPSSVNSKRKRDAAGESHVSEAKKLRKSKDTSVFKKSSVVDVAAAKEVQGEKKKKNRRKRKQRTRAADDSDDDSDNDSDNDSDDERSSKQKVVDEEPLDKEGDAVMKTAAEVVNNKPDSSSDVDMDGAEAADAVPEPEVAKKERKPKKEKKKKPPKDVPEEESKASDEKQVARHKAVLERKSKSIKLANEAAQVDNKDSDGEPVQSHGLEPLPQPAVVPEDDTKPTYETLPTWLSAPIRVSQDTRTPFTELGISQRPSRILAEKGYSEAFAVQTAAIPLLLPSSKQQHGDLLVSAATGSGKTLAYALPIVRDISGSVVTRLRALVVLPTRELVRQAQEVFEICAKAHESEDRKRVRVGVAVGSQSIKSEQEVLIERDTRYDPDSYEKILDEDRKQRAKLLSSADVDDAIDPDDTNSDPRLGAIKGDVVDFMSKVDILICTPGRLVEHIEQTSGFSLDYIRWLVVDEADKLLAQSFQGWLTLVLQKFQTEKFSARDFPDMAYSGVRKVILSATLTRDLSLLSQLALRRPRLIVLENDANVQVAEHTLPMLLREYAVRVHETNLKPLYLLDLLRERHMNTDLADGNSSLSLSTLKESQSNGAHDGSDTSSDDDSDSSSDSSDTSSSSDSSSSDDESTKSPPAKSQSQLPISLIFTKSNESALRLSRLLTLLDASLESKISTLTSTTPTHIRRRVLRAFTTPSSPVRLIIASDLVARGIDIPKLGHVINYDLPASVAGYVHRVGRTARAGRAGCAWTLVGDDESGWFWGKIAKSQGVKRAQKVERTRIDEMSEERIQEYEDALAKLGKEALELRRKK